MDVRGTLGSVPLWLDNLSRAIPLGVLPFTTCDVTLLIRPSPRFALRSGNIKDCTHDNFLSHPQRLAYALLIQRSHEQMTCQRSWVIQVRFRSGSSSWSLAE